MTPADLARALVDAPWWEWRAPLICIDGDNAIPGLLHYYDGGDYVIAYSPEDATVIAGRAVGPGKTPRPKRAADIHGASSAAEPESGPSLNI